MDKVEREYYFTLFEAIRKLADNVDTEDSADELGQLAGLAQAGMWMASKCSANDRARPAIATAGG